ncbi:MAG: riboflavin biosynthesis protein RibF [Candidatus Sumerlaeia bacterium]|nr:riboflavin biosynthesis protein RibF [Candidatus Sumerlaeia bacterium]
MSPDNPKLFELLSDIRVKPDVPIILTIGTFDGMHRGHQALLREAGRRAREINGLTAVLTFQNHPRAVLEPESAPLLLTNWERKKQLIQSHNPDIVTGLRFDRELARVEAADFVRDVIHGRFHAQVVISGPGFHFGHNRLGGPNLLEQLGREIGFEYFCHEYIRYKGEPVSSTRIRRALAEGDVEMAEAMMTRPHRFQGTVVTGDKIGRTIGFPTANLVTDPEIMLPANGVYVVKVFLPGGDEWGGMMNIGWRPTVDGKSHRVEAHLLGFEGDLVDKKLEIEMVTRLRDERRFSGIDDLREQLEKDRNAAINVLGETLF